MNLIIPQTIAETDIQEIRTGLQQHNQQYIDFSSFKPLVAFYTDAQNKKISGIVGYSMGNWLQIDLLWTNPQHRSTGLGTNLLQALENEAKKSGCCYALVDTFSFQAKPFYEKNGYTVRMVLPNYPLKHDRYYLTKDL